MSSLLWTTFRRFLWGNYASSEETAFMKDALLSLSSSTTPRTAPTACGSWGSPISQVKRVNWKTEAWTKHVLYARCKKVLFWDLRHPKQWKQRDLNSIALKRKMQVLLFFWISFIKFCCGKKHKMWHFMGREMLTVDSYAVFLSVAGQNIRNIWTKSVSTVFHCQLFLDVWSGIKTRGSDSWQGVQGF